MSGSSPTAQTDAPPPPPVEPRMAAIPQAVSPAQMQPPPQQAQPQPPPQQAQPQPAPQQAQPSQPAPQQAQPSQPTQGAVPTTVAESEPPPRAAQPLLDPRPYASLAQHAPQYRAMVDKIADETGVSPQRLALTWMQEGGFKTSVPDGKAGERGPLQVIPSTAARFDKDGHLDPHSLEGSLTTAGRFINSLDSRFGKDTPSSVGAYQGGEGSVADIAAHPERAMQDHPNTMARIKSSFPGQDVTPAHFTKPMDMDPQALLDAGKRGGPEGFLTYVSQTAQQAGTSLTDGMRAAEATLVGYAAMHGNVAGMREVHNYALQMSHAGANQNLMAAHQALTNGDGRSASQYLAKAHAFFPDGTAGQFGTDSSGQVWGVRMDERNPGKTVGQPFKVTQDTVATMLNQTSDPVQYMQTVRQEQAAVAATRYKDAMGDYYGNLLSAKKDIADAGNKTKETIAAGHDDARQGVADTNAASREEAARIRADGRQGQGAGAKMSAQADKEAAANFNDITMPDVDEGARGRMAETYHDVRTGGVTEPQSLAVTKGIHSGKLQLVRGQDGRYGVIDPKDKSGHPIAIVSQALGDRLAGSSGVAAAAPARGAIPGAAPQPGVGGTPIGAGASTRAAQVAGVTNNLSGTVQQQPSSALPVSQ